MNQTLWYLTRSTGIVAAVLMVAALLWGFLFSARATGKRLRPAWWLDLHNWLGGASLAFTAIHIVTSFLQTDSGIGLVEIFVPGTANQAWPIAWGVVATYLLALTVFTTWPKKLANRRLWRTIHLSSVAATALALLHGYQSGSDSSRLVFRSGLAVLGGVLVYGLGLRIFGLIERKQAAV